MRELLQPPDALHVFEALEVEREDLGGLLHPDALVRLLFSGFWYQIFGFGYQIFELRVFGFQIFGFRNESAGVEVFLTRMHFCASWF